MPPPNASPSLRGYVVAGGRSSRMGRDKALLPFRGATLIEHAIETLHGVVGDVRILCGPTRRYEDFGVRVVVDDICGAGPIAGMYSALVDASVAGVERVVWLAVDLPLVTSSLIGELVGDLIQHDVSIARTTRGLEPLCAAFRVGSSLEATRRALTSGRLRLTDAFTGLSIRECPQDDALLANVNTSAEFDLLRQHSSLLTPSDRGA